MGNHLPAPNRATRPLTSTQAAAALGISQKTLRRYIADGLIRCHRLPGRHFRIPPEAIEEFWAEQDRRLQAKQRRRPAGPLIAPSTPPDKCDGTRRPKLGQEPARDYDISPEHLARLRAQSAIPTTQGIGR